MNRASFGDLHQPLPLRVVELAGQLDVAIDVIDRSLRGLAIGAVFRVNARVPQRHSHPLERPALAVGVHPHRHGGARPERGQQQIVGCRPCVVADRSWLVGDEPVVTGGDLWVYVPEPASVTVTVPSEDSMHTSVSDSRRARNRIAPPGCSSKS